MVVGALLVHGTIVGGAALWPTQNSYVIPDLVVEMDLADKLGDPEVKELIVADVPTPPPDQPTPPPEDTPAPEDTPPPMEDQEIDVQATPPPPKKEVKPAPIKKPTGTPAPANAKRGPVAQEGVVGGNPAGTKTTGTPGGLKVGPAGWKTPKPPYPYQARAAHVTGITGVRITTDASGNISSVAITKSSGSGILDSNATSYIRANWKGPPNASFSKEVEYRLN